MFVNPIDEIKRVANGEEDDNSVIKKFVVIKMIVSLVMFILVRINLA